MKKWTYLYAVLAFLIVFWGLFLLIKPKKRKSGKHKDYQWDASKFGYNPTRGLLFKK